MSHEVESMAYAQSGGVPWHGLGKPVRNNMTVDEMLVAAELNWNVAKKPMFLESGKKVPGKFALVRDTDESILSHVGQQYVPVQNKDALSFFKKFVEAGHMELETAGSLRGGQFVWGLAKINKNFIVRGEDKIEGYLLISQPHVIGKALVIQFTPIRVVCMNTLQFALGSNLRGSVNSFRMPHVRAFDDSVKRTAEQALGLATEQLDEFQEAAELLSNTPFTDEQTTDFFKLVFKSDIKDKDDSRTLHILQDAYLHAPGADMKVARGTAWGAVNAVTYVVDHRLGRNRDISLSDAFFGYRSRLKRNAMKIAMDMTKEI